MAKEKYHHRIPKTYLRSWGENVWYYDKSSGKNESRNIDSIMGHKFFHSIKAGSLFYTSESLNKIFGCLDNYTVYYFYDEEKIMLDTKEEMNKYWYDFDNWIIEDCSGSVIPKKERNTIKTMIDQTVDNTIEEEWNKKYENDWLSTIMQIYEAVRKNESKKLTTHAFEILIRYFVLFQWRGDSKSDPAKDIFIWIMDLIPEIRDMELEKPVNTVDKTVSQELWHAHLLKNYYDFLKDDGMMEKQCKAYMDKLTLVFMIDRSESLITSDSPCFNAITENGEVQPCFIALPGLLISLAKKNPDNPLVYKVIEISNTDVKRYNSLVFHNGSKIISKEQIQLNDYLP